MSMAGFYVYTHTRRDNGEVFYVGKGKGARLRVKQHRSNYWRGIVKKACGFDAAIVSRGLDEELALLAEVELIAKFRALRIGLVNFTDGGEGMSGYVRSPESIERGASKLRGKKRPDISAMLRGRPKSEEHRRKLAAARRGTTASDDARARMSAAQKGRPSPMIGKRHRAETIEKIRAANAGDLNKFKGRKHTPESLAKMSAAHKGVKRNAESIAKQRASIAGERNHLFGKPVSSERKEKQAATLKATLAASRVACPHCGRVADKINASRWHFENCRSK